jgi:nitrous oxidase accessory protein NosD
MKTSTAARVVLVSAISVAFSAIALAGPVAAATHHHRCLVVDVTTGASFHHLQPAVDAAPPGAKLRVKGTCVGTTVIGRNIRIVGHRKPGFGPAVVDGHGHGPVVTIAGDSDLVVTLKGLRIRNGTAAEGGGIDVPRDPRQGSRTVKLIHSVVSGNTATSGGGGIMVGRGSSTRSCATTHRRSPVAAFTSARAPTRSRCVGQAP